MDSPVRKKHKVVEKADSEGTKSLEAYIDKRDNDKHEEA